MGGAVTVVGDGLDIVVDGGVDVFAPLAVVDAAGDDVPEMRNHAGGDKHLAVVVEIETPRIAETVGDNFEAILRRMIAPDAAVDVLAVNHRDLFGKRLALFEEFSAVGGFADRRAGREALAAIEPAIGPPVEAVERFMAVLDAPAGETNLDGGVSLVVAVLVRDEEEIRRRAEPETVEAHRDGRGKRDAFDEDLAGVEFPVAVGVFEDDDAAVAVVGEAGLAGFVVAIFRDPHAPAVVPAKGHRLGDHRFGGGEFRFEASGDGHFGGGLFAGEEGRLEALGLGEAPKDAVVGLAGVGLPALGHLEVVECAGVDDELMADGLSLALGDGPVAGDSAARADAELAIDAPRERVVGVFRMIEHGDVRLVGAALEFETDVDPDRALTGGAVVALAVAVDHGALHASAPRHADEEPAVFIFRDGEIDETLAPPFEIKQVAVATVAHGPRLRLGHDRLPGAVEEMVNSGPFDFAALRDDRLAGDAAPVAVVGVVEIVSAVDAREAPVDAGLVLVVIGAKFGEDALAVG